MAGVVAGARVSEGRGAGVTTPINGEDVDHQEVEKRRMLALCAAMLAYLRSKGTT